MIEVAKAIKTRWVATSLGSSITGGIHHSRVPERTAMPYCVFHETGSPVIQKSRSRRYSECQIQFDVYGDDGDAETVGDLAVLGRDAMVNAEHATTSPLVAGGNAEIFDAELVRNVTVESDGAEQVYRAIFEVAFRFGEPRNLQPG